MTRVRQLLYAWDTVWQKEMPKGCKTLAYHRRGFAYRGAITASQFDDTDDPRLHLLEYLELTPDVSPRRLAVVMKQSVFTRVKELVVRGDRLLGWAGAGAIAEGEYPRLERLVLARQSIGNIGLRALCESWGLPRLRELDVRANDITDDGLATLIRSSLIIKLRRIELSENPISVAMRDRVRPGHREW